MSKLIVIDGRFINYTVPGYYNLDTGIRSDELKDYERYDYVYLDDETELFQVGHKSCNEELLFLWGLAAGLPLGFLILFVLILFSF